MLRFSGNAMLAQFSTLRRLLPRGPFVIEVKLRGRGVGVEAASICCPNLHFGLKKDSAVKPVA